MWARVTGDTIGLIQKEEGKEWIGAPSAEFALTVNGRALGLLDFGQTEWSEENGPIGATLVVHRRSDEVEFEIRTVAFHEFPALLRSTEIRNLSESHITAKSIASDIVSLDAHAASRWTSDASFCPSDGPIDRTAFVISNYGLMFQSESASQIVVATSNSTTCTIRQLADVFLAPAEAHVLDASLIFPFNGSPAEAAHAMRVQCMRWVRETRRHQKRLLQA